MWKVLIGVWLLTVSVSDIRFRRVSIWLLVAGGLLAVVSAWYGNGCSPVGYYETAKGMAPGILLSAVAFGTKSAGIGDGITLMILGMISGSGILPVFGFSLFFIAVFSLALLVLRRAGRNTRIPYLPFLASAWLLVMLF